MSLLSPNYDAKLLRFCCVNSDENMRFYLTVESFKTRPPPLDEEARRIYDTFLAPDALDSVNVDAGGVARVSEAMNRIIEANLFNDAQVCGNVSRQ